MVEMVALGNKGRNGVGDGAGFRLALASQIGILCLCGNLDSPPGRFILESLKEVSEPSVSGVPAPLNRRGHFLGDIYSPLHPWFPEGPQRDLPAFVICCSSAGRCVWGVGFSWRGNGRLEHLF